MTTKIEKSKEEVLIVTKQGFKTVMPSLWMAESYAKGTWKGSVDRIEVVTTYKVEEE